MKTAVALARHPAAPRLVRLLALLALLAGPIVPVKAWALTTTWAGGSGDWFTSSGWDNGVPGPGDDAVVTGGPVTLGSNSEDTAVTLASLSVNGGTLNTIRCDMTLNGASSVSNNGTFALGNNSRLHGTGTFTSYATFGISQSIVDLPVVNQAFVIGTLTSAINGSFTQNGVLSVHGLFVGLANLTIANGFTSTGDILLGSKFGANATLNVTSGTLVNLPGSRIIAQLDDTGQRALNAELDNRGQLILETALTINRPSSHHANSGTIDASLGNLTVTQSGTAPSFVNSGTLVMTASRTISITGGGSFTWDGGTLPSAGTLSIASMSPMTLNADLNPSGALTLNLNTCTLTGSGQLINDASLRLNGCTVAQPFVNHASALIGAGSTQLNGAITLGAGSTLDVMAEFFGGCSVQCANGFTNGGTINLSSAFAANNVVFGITSGTLVNPVGSAIRVLAGSGGTRTLAAQLDNQGLLALVSGPLVLDKPSADHRNDGTLDASGGNLTLTQTGSTPSFTTSGPVTIGAGKTLAVSGGDLIYDGGAWAGGGNLNPSSVQVTLHADFAPSAVASYSGCTFDGTGHLLNTYGNLRMTSCTVNTPFDQRAYGLFTGSVALNGAVTTNASAFTQVAAVFGSSASVTTASGFTNQGLLELLNVGGGPTGDATLTVNGGALTNTGSIRIHEGGGGIRRLNAELVNQGSLTLESTDLILSKASAHHANQGTINVTGGNLTITQSGTAPSFTNSGSIYVEAGRTLTSTTGSFLNAPGGQLLGRGTYNIGGTLTNSGVISPGQSPGILSVTGNVPFVSASDARLKVEINGLTAGTQYDRLVVSGTAALHGTLEVVVDSAFCIGAGDAFRVLTAGTRSGTFDAVSVHGRGNPIFNAQYDATGLTLLTVSNDLTLTSGATGGGSIAPSGAVPVVCGGSQTFTIAAAACHHLVDVVVDGASVGPVGSYTFSNVGVPHTITASFAIDTYTIAVGAGPGGAISPGGTVTVDCGTSPVFTVTPEPCHAVTEVLVDGVSVGAVSSYTFNGVAASHTISATFHAVTSNTITASAAAGGSITPSGDTTVPCGSDQTYDIAPAACHRIADVLVDGVSVGAVSSYTFTDVTTPHTIAASFALLTYVIDASVDAHGGVSPSGAVAVDCGTDRTFTIGAGFCHHIADVQVDGVSVGPVTSYTFDDVTANHTLVVTTAPDVYALTATAGPGGAIDPGGVSNVPCGVNQHYTITPATCYEIEDVRVDGVSVGSGESYDFFVVSASHTIHATFVRMSFDIESNALSGGTIEPSGTTAVACGESQTFVITADACNRVVDVVVDGSSVGPVTQYTFDDVSGGHTIEAHFEASTLVIQASAGAGGSITPDGDVAVACGSNRTFDIVPNNGFGVVDVLVDGQSVGAVTSYTFLNVVASHTVAATFADVAGPVVHVVSADGGEIWPGTSVQAIRWTAVDNVAVDSVHVEVSLHGADGPWTRLLDAAGGPDSLLWTVPNECSDSALVRVIATDALANSGSDASDGLFHIHCGTLDANGPGLTRLRLSIVNPVRERDVRLGIAAPPGTDAHLEILAVTGQRVWSTSVPGQGAERILHWDGRGSSGEPIQPGVYFARVTAAAEHRIVRFVVIH
jgi:hypothetical protein